MPADVLDAPKGAEIDVVETETQVPESVSILDAYMRDIAAIEGSGVVASEESQATQEPKEPAPIEAEATPTKIETKTELTPETPEPKTETRLEPKTEPTEDFFRDPRVQSEVDRRAAALAKARQDQWQIQESQRLSVEAQAKYETEYQALVDLAASDDEYDVNVQEARKTLAKQSSVQKLHANWEREAAQRVASYVPQEVGRELAAHMDTISAAYERAYSQIPELVETPALLEQVHHLKHPQGDSWVTTLVNTVADARVAKKEAELVKASEKRIADEVEARLTQRLAEQRTKMPTVDRSPASTGSGAGMPYRTALEAETAYNQGQTTAAVVRWARENLPYE